MRVLLVIAGVVLAAFGGVIAYRAAFVASPVAFVVSESSGSIRELHSTWRIAGGLLLLIAGASLAFLAARRRP